MTTTLHSLSPARIVLTFGLLADMASPAYAALYDEIQVYDDTINKPHEFGLETHLNTTPSGRTQPAWPGEVTPDHGVRATAELSYGLTKSLEAGLYLPTLLDRQNNFYLPGAKLRLKWIPRQASDGGLFYGANVEMGVVGSRFEESRTAVELRPILGYRTQNWLFVTNPVLGYALSPGYRSGGPDFSPQVKVTRTVAPGLALGVETYSDLGKLSNFAPRAEQNHSLYAVIDVDRKPWVFNLGIGHGLNPATDRWTIKAIFEVPLPAQ